MNTAMHNTVSHLPDVVLVIMLQATGLQLGGTLTLQLAAFSGALLAARMMSSSKKFDVWQWISISVSGFILAYYVGGYYCETRTISLQSKTALMVHFGAGMTSDFLIRILKSAGKTVLAYTPDVVKTAIEKVKSFFAKPTNGQN